MAKAKPKNSAAAFRSLEAEFADLCRDEHQATEAAAAKAKTRIAEIEAGIKDICKLAYPEDIGAYLSPIGVYPSFDEYFIQLLRRWFRSSGNAADYNRERDRLFVRFGEIAADKHRRTLEEAKRLHADFRANRDRQMAEQFRQKKGSSNLSPSDLKAEIGKSHNLRSRSASIAAINRGLKSAKPRKPRKA